MYFEVQRQLGIVPPAGGYTSEDEKAMEMIAKLSVDDEAHYFFEWLLETKGTQPPVLTNRSFLNHDREYRICEDASCHRDEWRNGGMGIVAYGRVPASCVHSTPETVSECLNM